MPTYAANTDVTVSKSRDELERTLKRYGATHFGFMSSPDRATIAFQIKNRQVRFTLGLPDKNDRQFTHTKTGMVASESSQEAKYDQAIRQKWRALNLVMKAKLESVESGISEFEQEFFANIVLPSGRTVYEDTIDQVRTIIDSGMPDRLMIEG
jgi:hypothetical protein